MDGKDIAVNIGQVSFDLEEDGSCIFGIKGELDHHSVREIREVIDSKLVDYRPQNVILDLNEVTFTDSAGLGLILGRYTRISGYGGRLSLINVPEAFMKILRLSGAEKYLSIENKSMPRIKKQNDFSA